MRDQTLALGTLFAGRYAVEGLLGRGGMGEVYLVHDKDVGDRVALKLMLAASGLAAGATERFRREVRLARRITSKHVARVHDLGESLGTLYFTMEYVEGKSLADVIEAEGRIELLRAVDIARQICAGLSAAHEAGVVHRDLKPANVLVSQSGRIVVTDFGIARALEDDPAAFRTVGLIGTPLYMSPEQLDGRPIGPETDIYALGLILFELCAAQAPFQGTTPILIAMERLQGPPPDPRTIVPMPDALAELILACLAPDPRDRPHTALGLGAALERAVTGQGEMGSTVFSPTTQRTPSPADPAVAVLPFRYRGPPEHDYLGDALQTELIDILARTRGLRVLASGATARFRDERDPKTVGKELRVDAIVDCEVRCAGNLLRMSARLVDVRSGVQTWSERFDSDFSDVLDVEERIGKRLAEALRRELTTTTHRGQAPAEAIELYLRARRQMSQVLMHFDGEGGAVDLLRKCLALAPTFRPAMSALAVASLRAWFVQQKNASVDYQAIAREAVDRAACDAAELSESHLAVAILAVQEGRFGEAVVALERALEIAPTHVEAHEYLGRLQCESGRATEGLARLRLVLDLDPTMVGCHYEVARVLAMRGDIEGSRRHLAILVSVTAEDHVIALPGSLRLAMWRGDTADVGRCFALLSASTATSFVMLAYATRAWLGEIPVVEFERGLDVFLAVNSNLRFRSVVLQFSAEVLCAVGEPARAARRLLEAANYVLVDLEWMDRCPAIEAVRSCPEFEAARRLVRQRAEAIWRV